MKVKRRNLTGTTDTQLREYEVKHSAVSRKAAAQGMVLLKNDGEVLPLKCGAKIALYGAGAVQTIKSGQGSGDVNSRKTVSIWEGLKNAGYDIVTEDWLHEFEQTYFDARLAWKKILWEKADEANAGDGFAFYDIYASTPFLIPAGNLSIHPKAADAAMFVLSRNAGEGNDRFEKEGDYYLTEEEDQLLDSICGCYERVILVINTGGIVDLSFLDKYTNIQAVLYIGQPGMDAGNALADVVSGKVVPSAKLTDSWAYNYADYPNSLTFSHNNGDTMNERYEEGIFVGYRYFDSFDIPVRYGFGYGLSYTNFSIETVGMEREKNKDGVCIRVRVKNLGSRFCGKEVVQVYCSCPQEKLGKEYRRLVGFQKTETLAPGESQTMEIHIPLYNLTSYDEAIPGWTLEKGAYGLFVGSSLHSALFIGTIVMDDDIVMVQTEHVCSLQEQLREKFAPREKLQAKRNQWQESVGQFSAVHFTKGCVSTVSIAYDGAYEIIPKEVREFVDKLTLEQLIDLSSGEVIEGLGSSIGEAGIKVPGAAAQTSECAREMGLADIVLADGPAGLRLNREYQTVDGKVVLQSFLAAQENGFLLREPPEKKGTTYYQYATAIPVGTQLAQTWDPEIVSECGKAVGEEMRDFGVTLWLAPGMNIHRNPLCGRNFEYYSEDPLLTGKMAAAMTRGVQSVKGCGTTIKHYACNNQEDNRMGSNSILSERTLREIYLKGFEIAVKESEPMAMMTSYNCINGVHTANSFDLCTKVARNEWGYTGLIMTDWTTTGNENCTASGCMRAGNDSVMPGSSEDHENIRQELAAGTLNIRDLKRSVARLVNTIWKSDRYEP